MKEEMKIYGRYLVSAELSDELCERFENAVAMRLGNEENGAVNFVMKHNWALPFLDSATGWFYREHLLRKKLELAFAILETAPETAEHFHPESYGPLHIFSLGFRGMKSVILALFGIVILKIVN